MQAGPTATVGTINQPLVRVRSAPSTQASTVARLRQGTRLTVRGREGDWYRVEVELAGGRRIAGWVAARLIDVEGREPRHVR